MNLEQTVRSKISENSIGAASMDLRSVTSLETHTAEPQEPHPSNFD